MSMVTRSFGRGRDPVSGFRVILYISRDRELDSKCTSSGAPAPADGTQSPGILARPTAINPARAERERVASAVVKQKHAENTGVPAGGELE